MEKRYRGTGSWLFHPFRSVFSRKFRLHYGTELYTRPQDESQLRVCIAENEVSLLAEEYQDSIKKKPRGYPLDQNFQ